MGYNQTYIYHPHQVTVKKKDMNKDNIQELLKPRYKVIADYPEIERHNIRIGDVITISESAMYADKTQDGTPVVAIDHEIFPAVFRRLEWWEDRDVKDMPQYLKSNLDDKGWAGNFVVEKVNEFHGDNNEYVAIDRDETLQYCTSWYLPATEAEYLNQPKQP